MSTQISAIHAMSIGQGLSPLKDMLREASVEVDYWGSRSIKINGSTEILDLNFIARRFADFVREHSCRLTMTEARTGLACVNQLRLLYQASDELIDNSSIITQICNVFRKLFDFLRDPCNRHSFQAENIEKDLYYHIWINATVLLRSFELVLKNPLPADDVIRDQFNHLPLLTKIILNGECGGLLEA